MKNKLYIALSILMFIAALAISIEPLSKLIAKKQLRLVFKDTLFQ